VQRTFILTGATIALLLGSAGGALAGPVGYSYDWEVSPNKISSDPGSYPPSAPTDAGMGHLHLQDMGQRFATGSTNVVATRVWVTSMAPYSLPAHFSHDDYTLSLTLTDKPSGKTGVVTFTGELDGTAWKHGSNITNTFTGPLTQTITLGNDVYTVTLGAYLPPGPPGRKNKGGIDAMIAVVPLSGSPPATPEPSTLALAGLGLTLTGFAAWRKRRSLALAT
jgi:hypothetical protein